MKALEKKISSERAKKPETASRRKTLEKIEKETAVNKELKDQLSQYSSNDPKLLSRKIRATEVAKTSANRWTENIFSIRSYCCSNFNISAEDFDKSFGVPPGMDVVD